MKSIVLLALILHSITSWCCTTFVIKTKDELVFGSNLDWVSENGLIVVNQRNQLKESIVFAPDESVYWTSRYGSITFNQFGKELPFGGINERGLVVEIMLADAEYPEYDSRKAVNELQWVQYQLDNCATIDEVIASDKAIRLSKVNQNLHFLIADKRGNVAVIEFIAGAMKVFKDKDLVFPVLENDTYETSLKRYRNQEGSRFATAADRVKAYETSDDSVIDYAFDILQEVALDGSWSVVYDIKNLSITFRTKRNPQRKIIDISAFDFDCERPALTYDLSTENAGNINGKFIPLTHELNTAKLDDAMRKNGIFLPDEMMAVFFRYHQSVECK